MKKLLAITMAFLLVVTGYAQTAESKNSWSAGVFNAASYNYGVSAPAVTVTTGAAAGTVSITVSNGVVKLNDGRAIPVFATSAPITIGSGSTKETITPSAVSGCSSVNTSCVITGTFTYAHGNGDRVVSGSAGLQEAINDASAQGGGQVVIDQQWVVGGGTTTIRDASVAKTGVGISDMRTTGPVFLGKNSTSYLPVAAFGATGALSLGTAGSTVGSVVFRNATSGSVTLSPVTGALGSVTVSLPATTGTVSLLRTTPCAAASATCTETTTNGMKVISGISGALNGASPSVAAVTFSTGFTSSSTYACTASPNGASAAIAAAGVAITYTSSTVVTFTSANGLSNPISFVCIGS